MNWANFVSFVRVLMIPLVVWLYFSGFEFAHLAAAVLFSLASLTDWLDGFLARKLNQASEFGAFIDPVADKLLVVTVLILLVSVYPTLLIATAIIISREILVSALREWMAMRGQRGTVKVAFSGKLKTTLQMIAVIVLLICTETTPEWLLQLGTVLINVAALLSIWSMITYFRNAWSTLFPGA